MDELLRELHHGLTAGMLASSGWNGVNNPRRLERSSGLWISHGTAWRYASGTTATRYINPLWEWAVVFEGGFVIPTPARVYTVTAPCSYIVPPGLHLGVRVKGTAALAAWFMVGGPLAGDALATCGGHTDEITVGAYSPAQAEHALRIARLLYKRPPGFPALLQAELWAFLAVATGAAVTEQHPIYSAEIERVLRYLDDHAREPPVSNASLARVAALAPAVPLGRAELTCYCRKIFRRGAFVAPRWTPVSAFMPRSSGKTDAAGRPRRITFRHLSRTQRNRLSHR